MRRLIAVTLIVALLMSVCVSALAEDKVTASTGIAGADEAQLCNIELAAYALTGTIVSSGEGFSFNTITGSRDESSGYIRARNSAGAYTADGGVDQLATTLYLALMQLGNTIRIDEKHNYGPDFSGSFLPDGSLAIQVDTSGNDLRFTNLGGILSIQIYITSDRLCCELSVSPTPADDSGQTRQRRLAGSARIKLTGSPGLINNVSLAAGSINDTLLLPNDLFSFNETVGPRTERYGYQSAINGRGVKVTGGGVAQVASALWLAIKGMDGIAIVEKSTYGGRYNQHYVESSNDAILTDYDGNIDFSFRNSGTSSLTIITYVDEGVLFCKIYRN